MAARRGGGRNGQVSEAHVRPTADFWILTVYLACVFLMGGGARGDIMSLVILRPAGVLLCAWALLRLDAAAWRHWRGLLVLAGALLALPALHLVPLPPAIWQALPGHGLSVDISKAIGAAEDYRPLSVSPLDTWNALFSLFVPLAVLLLAIGLPDRDRYRLLPVVVVLGGASAAMGALQALSLGNSALHFYRVDSADASDGLFVNRNHQALFLACLIPLVAVFANSGRYDRLRRTGMVAVALALLMPLLLVTGSRAGLIVGVLAVVSLVLLMPRTRPARHATGWQSSLADPKWLIGASAALLAAVIVLSRRAEAFQRLFASSPAEEARLRLWQPALRATAEFMPLGSGIGSFVSTYQIHETHDLLSPTYRNHAHNEFIEIAMTGGVPALLILAVAVAAWGRSAWRWMNAPIDAPGVLYGRLGSVLVFLFAVASSVDYPARVPSLACLLTLGAVWMYGGSAERPQSGRAR